MPRKKFSLLTAKEWVLSRGYKMKKVDITDNYFRFRQVAPSQISNYHMKTLPDGIKLVLGEKK
jgi:hypothetical protein